MSKQYTIYQRSFASRDIVAPSLASMNNRRPVAFVKSPKQITSKSVKQGSTLIIIAFNDACSFSQRAGKQVASFVLKQRSAKQKQNLRWVFIDGTVKGNFPAQVLGKKLAVDAYPCFFVFRNGSYDKDISLATNVIEVLRMMHLIATPSSKNEIKTSQPNTINSSDSESKSEIQKRMADVESQMIWNNKPSYGVANGPKWHMTFVYANWCGHCKTAAPIVQEWMKSNDYEQQWKKDVQWYMMEGSNPNTHEWLSTRNRRLMGYPTVWVWDGTKDSDNYVGELERFNLVALNQDMKMMTESYLKNGPPKPAVAHANAISQVCDENGCRLIDWKQNAQLSSTPSSSQSHSHANKRIERDDIQPPLFHRNGVNVVLTTNPSRTGTELDFVTRVASELQDRGYSIIHHANEKMADAARIHVTMSVSDLNPPAGISHANMRQMEPIVFTLRGKPMVEYLYGMVKTAKPLVRANQL